MEKSFSSANGANGRPSKEGREAILRTEIGDQNEAVQASPEVKRLAGSKNELFAAIWTSSAIMPTIGCPVKMSTLFRRLNRSFFRAVLRGLLVPTLRLKRAFAGPIEVFGDEAFLRTTISGIQMLGKMDSEMVRRFGVERLIIFQSGRSSAIAPEKGLMGIPESYIKWEEAGVVAYLVYAHFCSIVRRKQSPAISDSDYQRKVYDLSTDWMIGHGMVGELYDSFREELDPPKAQETEGR